MNKNFGDWCIENNRDDILILWDYDLNKKSPFDVSYKSNLKYWFKCPRGIHESELKNIQYFSAGRQINLSCVKCGSFAQHLIDDKGIEYFHKIWSERNVLDPWSIPYKSSKKAIFVCPNNFDHIYEMSFENYSKGQGCPYCSHRKIYKPESLGALFPEVFDVWSEKNKKTPYEYYPGSGKKVWFKCRNGRHDDYQQVIQFAVSVGFRCPKCTVEDYVQPTGEKSHNWRGGTTPINKLLRMNKNYIKWRTSVFERDNYTCQCCGKRGAKLNAHHILNFSDHVELRYNIDNGITLCEDCHDVTIKGSFHNIYGTSNNNLEQLQDYIQCKKESIKNL